MSFLRRLLPYALVVGILAFAARPARADKGAIIARDALIGAGSGLVIGLLTRDVGTWFLVGAISGGLVGYIDATGGLANYQNGKFYVALPTPQFSALPSGEIAPSVSLFKSSF